MPSTPLPLDDAVIDELQRCRQQVTALEREQKRLMDFGRASGDWMWETDEALRTIWLSTDFETMTGIAPDTVLGREMADLPLLDAQGTASPHRGTLGELMRRHQPFSRAVTRKPTPRGPMYVSRSAVPSFDVAGRFTGYRGTARDVSAQVAAMRRSGDHELALRRSEERWEMAADAAGIGIAEADLATGQLLLDRRACINHGLPHPLARYTLDEWLQSIHPDDRDAARDGLQGALSSHGTLETRYRLQRPDGAEVTLEITARGRYDAHGAPIGLVGTCRDVTAQAAVERLRRDKEAAERANRAKSEFLSRVSHELRTPLNGVLGFAQLMSLDRTAPLATEQQRRLDSVVRAGRHLLNLINDVLDLTRIESDDFSLHPACVDAWAALGECLALIQPLAQEAGVTLPVLPSGPRAACWVEADPRALEQVLMNLLSNAIKYNRPAGTVGVSVDTVPSAGGERVVRIGVRDDGRGIGDEQQAALFQPFNRLGAELGRTQGSGLGLVISLQLVQAMRGRLHVSSRIGSGSVFTVELPAGAAGGAAAASRAEARPVPATHSTGPRQVLYIEDEPLNMVLMQEVFRGRAEWTLLTAEDGATGLRIARDARPDLVLADMNLPDMSGLALIGMLRADLQTRGLHCVALSADAMREQIEAALAAGFDDYWTKPIDVERVLDDLGRLLA